VSDTAVWAIDTARLYCRRVPYVMQRSGLLTPIGHIAWYTLCCVYSACSVYDSALIAGKRDGVDSIPAAGSSAAGRGGSSGDKDAGEADASEDDREGGLPMTSVPIDVHCGDGRVTGDEKCDIGIAAETSGACPTKCPDLAPCNPRALNNSGCQAECVLLQMVCMAGDGCCPGNCTDKNDSDCSSKCGDGVIQTESGETCEAESTTPCKMSDAECDDTDACTVDKLIGSAKNCNALCMNTRITAPTNDDGCCPTGSDANSDNDCKPVCGNKIREAGEDCDGTTGCSAACKLTLQADQIACLEKLGNAGDDCAKCSCTNCASTYVACRDGADAAANKLCNDVLECARKNDCYGTACYCGDSLFCAVPNGLCKAEVERAAGSTEVNAINASAGDPMSPLGRSYMADMCRNQQCIRQCR
jgi:hypothetical protein